MFKEEISYCRDQKGEKVTFKKSIDGDEEPHTTCFTANYPVHNWSKTSEEKWFENMKLRSNNDSPHSQNKLSSELEMENEAINSCRSKDFYNYMAYNTLPKKFVVSACLGVLVGQNWECFWH